MVFGLIPFTHSVTWPVTAVTAVAGAGAGVVLRTFGAAAQATWHTIYDVKGKLAGEVLLEGRVETGAGSSARCVRRRERERAKERERTACISRKRPPTRQHINNQRVRRQRLVHTENRNLRCTGQNLTMGRHQRHQRQQPVKSNNEELMHRILHSDG